MRIHQAHVSRGRIWPVFSGNDKRSREDQVSENTQDPIRQEHDNDVRQSRTALRCRAIVANLMELSGENVLREHALARAGITQSSLHVRTPLLYRPGLGKGLRRINQPADGCTGNPTPIFWIVMPQ